MRGRGCNMFESRRGGLRERVFQPIGRRGSSGLREVLEELELLPFLHHHWGHGNRHRLGRHVSFGPGHVTLRHGHHWKPHHGRRPHGPRSSHGPPHHGFGPHHGPPHHGLGPHCPRPSHGPPHHGFGPHGHHRHGSGPHHGPERQESRQNCCPPEENSPNKDLAEDQGSSDESCPCRIRYCKPWKKGRNPKSCYKNNCCGNTGCPKSSDEENICSDDGQRCSVSWKRGACGKRCCKDRCCKKTELNEPRDEVCGRIRGRFIRKMREGRQSSSGCCCQKKGGNKEDVPETVMVQGFVLEKAPRSYSV